MSYRRFPGLLAIASLALVPTFSGCGGQACTEIGCFDEARIDLAGLEPGFVYVVTAEGGGVTNRCTFDLTDAADPSSECDDFGGTDGENAVIILQGTPATVNITVERDGEAFADGSVTLEYEDFLPNGEGCEPVCQAGQATLAL